MMYLAYIAAALAAPGIVGVAAYSISKISKAASEAIGRQPEVANQVKDGIFLPLVLIESATVIGLFICIAVVLFK